MKKFNTFFLTMLCLAGWLSSSAVPYRSQVSGEWSLPGTWQTFNGAWGPTDTPPGPDDEVTIRSGHTVDILSEDAAAGFLLVESGASLRLLGTARGLTIHDGNAAADFIVNGLFQDNASSGAGNGISFAGGASWRLGDYGTLLRTNNSSAAKYRDFYHAGMSNIPATAHWIIRYAGLGDPSFTTLNTYYPNLTFESVSGAWSPLTGFSQFSGYSGTAVIKGNLDVGGSGAGVVTIVNENYNADPITVLGDLRVRSGSVLTNQGDVAGTGFRVKGQLLIDGSLNLGAGAGVLHLNGLGSQTLAGAGTIDLYDLEVNNPNGLSLQCPLIVSHDLYFFNGKVTLNNFDLTVLGEIVGYGSTRYVQTNGYGPSAGGMVRPSAGSVAFPVGNNAFNLAIVEGGSGDLRLRVEDRVLEEGDHGPQVVGQVVNRTWHLSGPPGAAYNLTLQWNAGEQMAGFDPSQCYVSRYDNGWQSDTPGPASGSGPVLRTRTGLQGSAVYAVASGGVLPATLVRFTGRLIPQEGVQLEWQTVQELNNAFFVVERLGSEGPLSSEAFADPADFREIGRVPGGGTTPGPRSYDFFDPHPVTGYNYYRLRQVDYDGTETLSSLVVIRKEEAKVSWELFPNPATHYVQVRFPEPLQHPAALFLQDGRGRTWRRQPLPAGSEGIGLDISELPSGHYVLILQQEGQMSHCRLIRR